MVSLRVDHVPVETGSEVVILFSDDWFPDGERIRAGVAALKCAVFSDLEGTKMMQSDT